MGKEILNSPTIYLYTGVILIVMGLVALVREPNLIRKILALNITASGIFLVLIALAARGGDGTTDPIPHAMVLTGIVVSVSATAVGLTLAKKYHHQTGRTSLPGEEGDE